MIRLWTYNELAAVLGASDTSAELYLPRPGIATSQHNLRIDQEIMTGSAWDAWTIANTIAGTHVSVGAIVDATKPIRRGAKSTKAVVHKKGAPVWSEWNVATLDADVVDDFAFLSFGAEPDAVVRASSKDGYGGWFIGGEFANVDGVGKTRCARIKASGILDVGFTADCNGVVHALALSLDRRHLAVGGIFTTYNGISVGGLAIVDPNTGILIQGFDVTGGGTTVFAMSWDGDDLYIGGDFTKVGPESAADAAKLTSIGTSNWSSGALSIEPNDIVRAIEIGKNQVYFGGDFTTFGGTTRNRLASIDSDEALTDWDPNAADSVYTIKEVGSSTYVGGTFTTINGAVARVRLAKLDTTYGALDLAFTGDCNAQVSSIVSIDDSAIMIAGSFTTVNAAAAVRLATVDAATGVLRKNFGLGTGANTISISDSRVGVFGSFTVIRDRALYIDASYAFSPIGKYQAQLIITPQLGVEIKNVVWRVYKDRALIYEGEEQTEFEPTPEGIVANGPELDLANPRAVYTIEATTTTSLSITVDFVSIGARTTDGVYLIPIGTESGDLFTTADAFTMPSPSNPVKAGNTYTLSLPDDTDSPTASNDQYFYRVFAILAGDSPDYIGGNRFTMTRSIGPVTEIVNMGHQALYTAEIDWSDQNAAFTLDLTFEDIIGAATTTISESHPGATSSLVNPDQVQIQREVDTGPLTGPQFGRFISDWIDTPASFQIQYANQGVSSYTYRYRIRYRDFRRDGVDDQRGPVEVTSAWSDWTPFV